MRVSTPSELSDSGDTMTNTISKIVVGDYAIGLVAITPKNKEALEAAGAVIAPFEPGESTGRNLKVFTTAEEAIQAITTELPKAESAKQANAIFEGMDAMDVLEWGKANQPELALRVREAHKAAIKASSLFSGAWNRVVVVTTWFEQRVADRLLEAHVSLTLSASEPVLKRNGKASLRNMKDMPYQVVIKLDEGLTWKQ
jgi:hypothetical protein